MTKYLKSYEVEISELGVCTVIETYSIDVYTHHATRVVGKPLPVYSFVPKRIDKVERREFLNHDEAEAYIETLNEICRPRWML